MGVPAEAVAEAYDAWEKGEVASPLTAAAISNQTIQESMRLLLMVRAFQVMGHYAGGRWRWSVVSEVWCGVQLDMQRACVRTRCSGPPAGRVRRCRRGRSGSRAAPSRPAAASLDPLGIDARPKVKELDPAFYGFTEKDLDRE